MAACGEKRKLIHMSTGDGDQSERDQAYSDNDVSLLLYNDMLDGDSVDEQARLHRFSHERVRDQVHADVPEETAGCKSDHGIELSGVELGRNESQDEVGKPMGSQRHLMSVPRF